MSHRPASRLLAALALVTGALVTASASGQTAGETPPTSPPNSPPNSPPATRPATPPTTPPTAPPTTRPTTPAADLIPAKAILEKGLDALGGRKAIDDIDSLRYKLVAEIVGGPAKFELRNGRNWRFFANGESTGGSIMMGRIGDVAWREKTDGTFLLMPPDRVGPDILGYLFMLVHPDTTAHTVDRTPFADTDCWKVEITDPKGEAAFAYFEAESGLIRGIDKVRRIRGEERITRTTFTDYRDVPPLHLFTGATMIQVNGAALAKFEFSDITYNDVPESDFVVPAAVTALVEEAKTPKTTTTAPASRPDDGAETKINPQTQRLLDRLQEMNDASQLEMIAGFIEMQLAKEEDGPEKDSMRMVVDKIRERVADIKATERASEKSGDEAGDESGEKSGENSGEKSGEAAGGGAGGTSGGGGG